MLPSQLQMNLLMSEVVGDIVLDLSMLVYWSVTKWSNLALSIESA